MDTLPIRYRKPYNSRHSYVSWRLMKDDNRLLVATEGGHNVTVMERTYAAWTNGTKPEDVELIKAAMADRPGRGRGCRPTPPYSPEAVYRPANRDCVSGGADCRNRYRQPSGCSSGKIEGTVLEELTGVEGLLGPDGPRPFGAADRCGFGALRLPL